jgi:hypothetical protein
MRALFWATEVNWSWFCSLMAPNPDAFFAIASPNPEHTCKIRSEIIR